MIARASSQGKGGWKSLDLTIEVQCRKVSRAKAILVSSIKGLLSGSCLPIFYGFDKLISRAMLSTVVGEDAFESSEGKLFTILFSKFSQ